MPSFGSRLRTYRQDLGFTMRDIGDLIGTEPSYISMVELGKRPPLSNEQISIISEVFAQQLLVGVEVVLSELQEQAAVSRIKIRGSVTLHLCNTDQGINDLAIALSRIWPPEKSTAIKILSILKGTDAAQ